MKANVVVIMVSLYLLPSRVFNLNLQIPLCSWWLISLNWLRHMRDLKEYNGRKKAIGKISEAGGQGVWKAREWFSSGRKVWQKVEPYVAQIWSRVIWWNIEEGKAASPATIAGCVKVCWWWCSSIWDCREVYSVLQRVLCMGLRQG